MDLLIDETGTGGDLLLEGNDLVATNSIKNQVYLALFGGNINADNGEQNNDYFGNAYLSDDNKFKSTVESLLSKIVVNSSGIATIKSAIQKDLEFLSSYANIVVNVEIKSKDSLLLLIDVIAPNNVSEKIRILWNQQTVSIL